MSPLLILLVALAVVIGGVLAFRLHAFVTLVVGALVVAALTPSASILRQEFRKDEVRVGDVSADGGTVVIEDRKQQVVDDSRYDAYRIMAGREPAKVAELHVAVNGQGPGRRVTARVTRLMEGVRPGLGDHVLSPAAVRVGVKIAGSSVGQRVAEGFGRTALDIGILIAMASILGTCLMSARGAERIVFSLQRAIGVKRTPLVFLASGFLLGIPMFAEAVFYLLLPLAKAMWKGTRSRYVLHVLAIVAGATMTHSLVPPTPGPLFAANELGVDLSLMILVGAAVGALAALSGYAYALWADRRWPIPLREGSGAGEGGEGPGVRRLDDLPPLLPSLLPILLPVVLISGASVMDSNPAWSIPGWLREGFRVFGDKNLALTVSAGLAVVLLAFRKRGDAASVRKSIRDAVVEAGEIILVIAGGGALGATLRQAGVSELATAAVPDWKLLLLPLAWAVTAVIRVAQGSATVAMITAVGIVGPITLAGGLGYHAVYVAVAIGCGSKIGMWMNDSGFWVISRMSGLNEVETLKTASAMVFIEGCVGLLATMVLASAWPMV